MLSGQDPAPVGGGAFHFPEERSVERLAEEISSAEPEVASLRFACHNGRSLIRAWQLVGSRSGSP